MVWLQIRPHGYVQFALTYKNCRYCYWMFFLPGSESKESACNEGDLGLILVRKISWGRKWQTTQYSCLEKSTDRRAWQATVHGIAKSQTRLTNTFTITIDCSLESQCRLIIIIIFTLCSKCITISSSLDKYASQNFRVT